MVFLIVFLLVLTLPATYAAESRADVKTLPKKPLSLFSPGESSSWEEKSFAGHTRYTFEPSEHNPSDNSGVVLNALSKNSASGLIKHIRVDLTQTPWLRWQWKITQALQSPGTHLADETSKSGDDYAARIYVIVDGGVLFWKTRALNYVWARQQTRNSYWSNPYAGKNAMMLALRSGAGQHGVWVAEKRNVYEDLKAVFGNDIRYIDAIAIMTDTDNTGGEAGAAYRDLYFSEH